MEIKDSGERTQFNSGAVRDMHEGKGRCDLLPMCVLLQRIYPEIMLNGFLMALVETVLFLRAIE